MREKHSGRLPALDGRHETRSESSKGAQAHNVYVPYVGLICRLVLGGVFAYAGASKILDPGGLAASIRSYGLGLAEWFVSFSAHALPYLEVLLGLYLIAGLFTRASAWTANVLMLVFIGALLQGALRGLDIDCGCFGSGSGGVWGSVWLAFARDLGLLGLGLWIVRAGAGRLSLDARIRPAEPDRRRDGATVSSRREKEL